MLHINWQERKHEAKVTNGKNSWTLVRQYEEYRDKANKPKDITSNFFRQIALKELLIMNKTLAESKGVISKDNRVMGVYHLPKTEGDTPLQELS